MSFARGRFGIEYNAARRQGETHRLRWVFLALGVLVLVSFISFRVFNQGAPRRPAPDNEPSPVTAPSPPSAVPVKPLAVNVVVPSPKSIPTPVVERSPQTSSAVVAEKPAQRVKSSAASSRDARRASQWEAAAENRPNYERTLLLRLAEAERLGRTEIVRDSLKKLRTREAMRDLQDPLSRRLGELNMKWFRTGSNDWTRVIEVRRGDSVERLAREHGTTVPAVLTLNSIKDSNRVRMGQKLVIPEFPKAMLSVEKRTGVADLSLKGAFFRRFYVKTSTAARSGFYKFEGDRSCRAWLTSLGITVTAVDMKELELFLAPGTTLTLTDL